MNEVEEQAAAQPSDDGTAAVTDISIVLNLHRESNYLPRTMASLNEAVQYSRHFGRTFELIVVLDRPDDQTRKLVAELDFEAFANVSVIEVENGSLGPSRNDGIALAQGAYVATADGDDLISFNYFESCLATAASAGPKTIVFAKYLLAFGEGPHFWEYFGSGEVSSLLLAAYNIFISRIFCHRAVFATLRYADARGGLRAFEDWHFNCEAAARGFNFEPASRAVIFYRRRAGSITATAGYKVIPPSAYFDPATFLKLCGDDYARLAAGAPPKRKAPEDVRWHAQSSYTLLELIRAANRIDPMVEPGILDWAPTGSNGNGPEAMGAAYYEVCSLIGTAPFTDVVLLPHLHAGGGEKYILEVLKGLSRLDGSRRILVLCGEQSDGHPWSSRLPEGTVLVDLHEICRRWDPHLLQLLTLRVIQSAAPGATVHVKPSVYGNNFVLALGPELREHRVVFYYFSDPMGYWRGAPFTFGSNFSFVSEAVEFLTHVVSDHQRILDDAAARLPLSRDKFHTLYAPVSSHPQVAAPATAPAHRLLWASRLAAEKRPDLLARIAAGLLRDGSPVEIDIYGRVAEPSYLSLFRGLRNVHYCGSFDGFETITGTYDAFLYTSAYDGMPNVVLEAMAAGLVIIAPDLGGIGETIGSGRGILVPNAPDPELVQHYLDAIAGLYVEGAELEAMRTSASALLGERHSASSFERRLREVFALEGSGTR